MVFLRYIEMSIWKCHQKGAYIWHVVIEKIFIFHRKLARDQLKMWAGFIDCRNKLSLKWVYDFFYSNLRLGYLTPKKVMKTRSKKYTPKNHIKEKQWTTHFFHKKMRQFTSLETNVRWSGVLPAIMLHCVSKISEIFINLQNCPGRVFICSFCTN